MFKKVILNGVGRSGKDKLVEFARELFPHVTVLRWSTVGTICRALDSYFGITTDEGKTDEYRMLVHRIKAALSDYNDYTTNELKELIGSIELEYASYPDLPDTVLFVMCREPKEIEKIVKIHVPDAITVLVQRPSFTHVPDNPSDQGVYDYSYNYYITADSLDELKDAAQVLMKQILKED